MPHSRYNHCQAIPDAIVYRILIPDRAAGLDEGGHSCAVRNLHAVIEWKERIACQDRPIQVKIELACLCDRLSYRIDAAGLSASLADELPVLHQGDGIGFKMLANYIGEDHVLSLAFGGSAATRFL